jgi:hypothetical protein
MYEWNKSDIKVGENIDLGNIPPFKTKKPRLPEVHPSVARPSSKQQTRRFLPSSHEGFSFIG